MATTQSVAGIKDFADRGGVYWSHWKSELGSGFQSARGDFGRLAARIAYYATGIAIGINHPHVAVATKRLGDFLLSEEALQPVASSTDLFERVFQLGDSAGILPGASHADNVGIVSPNNIWAAQVTALRLFAGDELRIVATKDNEFLETGDFDRSFIPIGSPTSSLLARLVLQYDPIDPMLNLGLRRMPDPVLHLPFEYELDKARIGNEFLPNERFVDGELTERTDWFVRDMRKGGSGKRLYESDKDCLLLTLTRNFLDKKAFDQGRRILIVGGAHGPGTLAFELALRDMTKLYQLAKGSLQYSDLQITIPISRLGIDPATNSTIPIEVDFGRAQVERVEVDEKARTAVLDEIVRSDPRALGVGYSTESRRQAEVQSAPIKDFTPEFERVTDNVELPSPTPDLLRDQNASDPVAKSGVLMRGIEETKPSIWPMATNWSQYDFATAYYAHQVERLQNDRRTFAEIENDIRQAEEERFKRNNIVVVDD